MAYDDASEKNVPFDFFKSYELIFKNKLLLKVINGVA